MEESELEKGERILKTKESESEKWERIRKTAAQQASVSNGDTNHEII